MKLRRLVTADDWKKMAIVSRIYTVVDIPSFQLFGVRSHMKSGEYTYDTQ